MNNMLATFQFGKSAVQNGKVVKITGWARKKTLQEHISQNLSNLKKDPIGEILENSFKILSVHSS